jgi:magnesium transporter
MEPTPPKTPSRPVRKVSHRPAPGSVPGTLAKDASAKPTIIQVIGYGPDAIAEETITDPKGLSDWRQRFPIVWVNVSGLANADLIKQVGDFFQIHQLALADAVNNYQRPKMEQYDTYDFIIARMANRVDAAEMEQLGLFLGDRFVLTFQETPGDCFNSVRERLRKQQGRLRRLGADALAYSILDATVDFYFPVLEHYGESLDGLEEDVLLGSDLEMPSRLHGLKRDLLTFRRSLWPLRDALNAWLRDPGPRLTPETAIYLRDCYDHVAQLLDLLETYRELASDLLDIHLSVINTRMNEVMKVLTIISTIFIPMTFIASIYGMNFKYMPELNWRWGYPFALFLMALIAAGMLRYFRKKKWF